MNEKIIKEKKDMYKEFLKEKNIIVKKIDEINSELQKEKEKNIEIDNLNKELKDKISKEIQKYNNLNIKLIELNKEY